MWMTSELLKRHHEDFDPHATENRGDRKGVATCRKRRVALRDIFEWRRALR